MSSWQPNLSLELILFTVIVSFSKHITNSLFQSIAPLMVASSPAPSKIELGSLEDVTLKLHWLSRTMNKFFFANYSFTTLYWVKKNKKTIFLQICKNQCDPCNTRDIIILSVWLTSVRVKNTSSYIGISCYWIFTRTNCQTWHQNAVYQWCKLRRF